MRVGARMALVVMLLVVAALTVGYATAGKAHVPTPVEAVRLSPVRVHSAREVTLAKLTLTSRLESPARPARTVATEEPATTTTTQTPTVTQPVTPAPTRTQTPSAGGSKTFDSSG